MPFLIPAVIAFSSDAFILWLNGLERRNHKEGSDFASDEDHFVYHVQYLIPLAWIRLILLSVPLLFHSYRGTALQCPALYQVLYWGTLVAVLIHMLSLSCINPASLEAIVPNLINLDGGGFRRYLLEHLHALRRIWWILVLSCASDICHLVVFWHVRSTAPPSALYSHYFWTSTSNSSSSSYSPLHHQSSGKQPSIYYALRSRNRTTGSQAPPDGFLANGGGGLEYGNEEPQYYSNYHQQHQHQQHYHHNNEEPALMHAMNDFMLELNTRLQHAKKDWTARLDDFTLRLQNQNAGEHPQRTLSSSSNHHHHHHHHHHNPLFFAHISPFRVILQLFAYEDVLHNGKLQAVFDLDDGATITFFVPQLLTFLLHGASLDCSPLLEDWILQQCRRNIYFAHRCYWFLRAWCLRQQVVCDPTVPVTEIVTTSGMSTPARRGSSSSAAIPDVGAGLAPFLDEPGSPEHEQSTRSSMMSTCNPRRFSSGSLLLHDTSAAGTAASAAGAAPNSSSSQHAHFLVPEEQQMMERLMLRVKECGEEAAHVLEFGYQRPKKTAVAAAAVAAAATAAASPTALTPTASGHSSTTTASSASSILQPSLQTPDFVPLERNDSGTGSATAATTDEEQQVLLQNVWNQQQQPQQDDVDVATQLSKSQSSLAGAIQLGIVPTRPFDNSPSLRHFEVLSSVRRFGFLPLDTTTTTTATTTSGGGRPPLLQQQHRRSETEQFDKAPQFSDALLRLADSLFGVPRAQRKEELRRQLRNLECDLLPSNAVYLPVGGSVHHRVWRIVADESIAISTKERVPCIVCLEVIDTTTTTTSSSTRRGRHRHAAAWRFLDRLPRRSDSALSGSMSHNNSAHPQHQHHPHHHGPYQHHAHAASAAATTGATTAATLNDLAEMVPLQPSPSSAASSGATAAAAASAFAGDTTGSGVGIGDPSPEGGGLGGGRGSFLSEADLVRQWRDAPRNPSRRTSIFEKVKVVKSQIQDNIKQFRERTVSDELQSLTLAEALVEPVLSRGLSAAASAAAGTTTTTATTTTAAAAAAEPIPDVESGMGMASAVGAAAAVAEPSNSSSGGLSQGLSRSSSGASLVSMGQWSSPLYEKLREEAKADPNVSLGDVRRRMENELAADGGEATTGNAANNTSTNGTLRYGSDHEEEPAPSKERVIITPKTTTTTTTSPKSSTSRNPPVVFREDWKSKEERLRARSAYGSHPGWRLLPVLVKANDDLRQEQLASQLIYKMSCILAREKVPVWLYSYEIIAMTDSGGIIEAIPDTISLDSLKKNDPSSQTLKGFFHSHFSDSEDLADAKANFVESLAGYSIVCFLLQIKDRHNGNILLDNRGHLIHIDFGFFFLSSPGKNAGFESAPFKLTREMVELLEGPNSHLFRTFRDLCVKTFIALRRHCMELILLVEMLKNGNEELKCFRGRPDDAIQQLRERFRLDLNDRACREYVNCLVDDSIENWRTDWYDRYQRYFVGVL